MNISQSTRLIGRHFHGVVSSRGLSPDASQDVAKVFTERARIVVADGAGDTGAAAGEWAGVLALCYGSGEGTVPSKELEPEWLGRAVKTWNHAANLARFSVQGAGVNQEEFALLQRGVDASFIGAEFDNRAGNLSVNWVAAGDCEAFLFRGGHLHAYGPIHHWKDFTSTTLSLNSKAPQSRNLLYNKWDLEEGDILVLCTDALGQFILQACDDENCLPSEVHSLIRCTEWQDLRQHVEEWRQEGRLRNDDVAVVRVSIHRVRGAARFSLTQDTGFGVRTAPALLASRDETPAGPLIVVSTPGANDAIAPGETLSRTFKGAKVARSVPYGRFGIFALGLLVGAMLVGAMLPVSRMWTRPSPIEVVESQNGVDQKSEPEPTVPRPTLAPTDSDQTTGVVGTRPSEPAVTVSDMANQRQVAGVAPGAEEKGNGGEHRAATSNVTGKGRSAITSLPEPVVAAEEPLSDTTKDTPSIQNGEQSARASISPVQIDPLKPGAAPPTETTSAPEPAQQPGALQQVDESRAMAGAADLATEVRRDPAQTEQAEMNTSQADTQSKTLPPCTLPKGAKLYETPKIDNTPLLEIKAAQATCVVDSQDARRVTIHAWVDAGPTGPAGSTGPGPAWLSEGRTPQATNVRTAPLGDRGSEFIGNVRERTPFTVVKREEREGYLWVEVIIAAYRFAK